MIPVKTVLASDGCLAIDYILFVNDSINICFVSHFQVKHTDVFLCLTTVIRTIISFRIKYKGILLYLLSIYMYCNKMPVNIETAKELED